MSFTFYFVTLSKISLYEIFIYSNFTALLSFYAICAKDMC